jgi:anthranilate synthase component II
MLGVCLGHQCINEVFGGATIRAPLPCHGKTSMIRHDGKTIFAGLPQTLEVARYHSLIVDPATIPAELEVSAWTEDGVVMGLRHRRYAIEGVQFHPESFLTTHGEQMLRNYFEK